MKENYTNTIAELMSRKSIREFTDQKISFDHKQMILAAATQAPTAGNQQLYTILDITDQKLKEALVDTCDHQPFIAKADMVLIFCADCKKWYDAFCDTGCDPRQPGVGDLLLAVSDTNIAAQNAVTAAWSLGIGSCYIGDIMENCEAQRELLGLPPYVFPAAMLVFGYPTDKQMERIKPERAPMESIVSENRYPVRSAEDREVLFSADKKYDYTDWMKKFCARKYNSDFSREMTRSVKTFLKDFES